jgi:hypothetical protein
MLPMDILLLFTKHEPVEAHHDEVAHDRHRVKQVVPRL